MFRVSKKRAEIKENDENTSDEDIISNLEIDMFSEEEQDSDSSTESIDKHKSINEDDITDKSQGNEKFNDETPGESDSDEYITGDSLDENDLDLGEEYVEKGFDKTLSKEAQDVYYVVGANGHPRKILPEIDPVYDSDSSTENPSNTIGNVPMEWYEDYPHIGYDVDGKKIMKPAKGDELDKFLENMEDPDSWISAKDNLLQQNVKLTDEELEIIRRIQMGSFPEQDFDPYEPTVEWFTSKPEVMPLNATPEPKRRFIPSKWEAKRIMKIVRAIRQGRIVPGKTQVQKPRFYNLWNENDQPREEHPMHIPAPKMKLPDHDESYNPPTEYLLTEKEKEEWEKMDPEDREKNYMPQKHSCLRTVPAYNRFIQERFDRCLDLYLSPRVRKNKLNIDPESLIPKLPNPKDLQPFPTSLTLSYDAHTDRVRCISIDPTGLWLISGSDDKTIRLWEIITGRCVKTWELEDIIYSVAWCPVREICAFIFSCSNKVGVILPTGICDEEVALSTSQYVTSGFNSSRRDDEKAKLVDWMKPTDGQNENGILVIIQHVHNKTIKQITWHRKGDYFSAIAPDAGNQGILIHQLTRHQTQQPFRKTRGIVQCVKFHPIKPLFFVATQRYVRVYNLMKQELIKTLQSGVKWISSLDVHPMGDNVIIGSYDKKLCWFDLDLSPRPYRTLCYHTKAVRNVVYHKRLPLFASCSDDGTLQIFHGMVYNDLLQNPLIVPVKVLKAGHRVVDSLGVLNCEFHPTQPWIISSGADHTIKLWT
ncbi:ribosome biogenesis protein [Glomus cerebriforme]|uniref:Ribosome biogenesis protein ERB1 n=1 Tax=Glomus cerebriforme TaxID=658196 RepID=A0A397TNR0_9GLOM|nr:ribosome biogenesis protein [Glomus cerebriforme]